MNSEPSRWIVTIDGQFFELEDPIAVNGEEFAGLVERDKHIIAVAGRDNKIPAIMTLVRRGGLPFNVLIIDESLAEQVLSAA